MATPKVKVELIPSGMKELLRDRDVAKDMLRRMDRVAETARGTAVVLTGAYRDGITAWVEIEETAVGRAGSTVGHAKFVEADTGNMARALDAAG